MARSGTLHLTVMTPEQVVLHVDAVQRVRLKLADQAWLSIYPYHAPLVGEILPGPLQYDTEIETGEIAVGPGILQVEGDEVVVLTSGLQQEGHRDAQDEVELADLRFDRLADQLMVELNARSDHSADRSDDGEKPR